MRTVEELEPRCEACGERDEELYIELRVLGKKTVPMPAGVRAPLLCKPCRGKLADLLQRLALNPEVAELIVSPPAGDGHSRAS